MELCSLNRGSWLTNLFLSPTCDSITFWSQVLFALPYFSGQYVLGLTLDLQGGHVYWMVKDVHRALVYKTGLVTGDAPPGERTLVKELETPPK